MSCCHSTVWGELPSHTVWGELPSHTVWGELPSHTVWGELPSHIVWGELPSEHHLGSVAITVLFGVSCNRSAVLQYSTVWGKW